MKNLTQSMINEIAQKGLYITPKPKAEVEELGRYVPKFVHQIDECRGAKVIIRLINTYDYFDENAKYDAMAIGAFNSILKACGDKYWNLDREQICECFNLYEGISNKKTTFKKKGEII